MMTLRRTIRLIFSIIYRLLVGEYGVTVERYRDAKNTYHRFGKEFFDKLKHYEKVKEIYDEIIELDDKIKKLEKKKNDEINKLKISKKIELLKELLDLYEATMIFIQIASFYYYFDLIEEKFNNKEKEIFKEKIQKITDIKNQMELIEFRSVRYNDLLLEGTLHLTELWLKCVQKWVEEIRYLHNVTNVETERRKRILILMKKGKL